jgi:hypothetical protein
MEILKLLLPPHLQAEDSGILIVLMMMTYAYIKHFIPHAAEIAKNNITLDQKIREKNYELAMTCKKLVGPGLVLFAGTVHILFYTLSAIREIVELL